MSSCEFCPRHLYINCSIDIDDIVSISFQDCQTQPPLIKTSFATMLSFIGFNINDMSTTEVSLKFGDLQLRRYRRCQHLLL